MTSDLFRVLLLNTTFASQYSGQDVSSNSCRQRNSERFSIFTIKPQAKQSREIHSAEAFWKESFTSFTCTFDFKVRVQLNRTHKRFAEQAVFLLTTNKKDRECLRRAAF